MNSSWPTTARETSGKSGPPAGSYRVDVDLTNCVMSAYDASGNLVRQALCTVGAADTPTPEGTFTMGEDRRRFGYFEEHDCYAQYWSQIDGAIFFHSLLYENDGETLRMSSYENLGRASSHGCVRLTVPRRQMDLRPPCAGQHGQYFLRRTQRCARRCARSAASAKISLQAPARARRPARGRFFIMEP